MTTLRVLLVLLSAVLALPQRAGAREQQGEIRGGWVTSVGARTGTYLIIVRGTVVSGTYCVDCADPDDLAFIMDGELVHDEVKFVIRHEDHSGAVSFDDVRGRLRGTDLVLSVKRRGAGRPTQVILHRPAPAPEVRPVTHADTQSPGAALRSRPSYVAPGPARQLSADQVRGLWLSGSGPGKQYFIIRRAGAALLGMVCGPCDKPAAMAPLDGFRIEGTALTFNIVHEDTGGAAERGPFNNVAHATVARNEMHLRVIPSYEPADSQPFEMTLLGPVTFER